MVVAAGTVTAKKAVARVVLADLDEPTCAVLNDCFRQFGIRTVVLSGDASQRLQKEKFEALVLRLSGDAGTILEAARNSPSNRRIVIYGIASGARQACQFTKYGVNAVLDEPLERQATLRVVRATHLLVVHELRRYVRIPIIIEVTLHADAGRIRCHSVEISAGGMSVRTDKPLAIGQTLQAAFDLPGKTGIRSGAAVCWLRKADGMAGLRFDAEDERRWRVREWIDDYLDIS